MRVLFSLKEPTDGGNPYFEQLVHAVQGHATCQYWQWRRAFRADVDVIHLHLPEYLRRDPSRVRRLVKSLLLLGVALRWRLSRVAVVQTIHNEEPHESGGRAERLLLRLLDSRVDGWVKLNPSTPDRPPRTSLAPIGDLTAWFDGHERPDQVPGRLVFFGLIRPYKGLDRLMAAFRDLPADVRSRHHLRVVGLPHDPGIRADVERAAAADDRVSLDLRRIDDAELVREISEAQLAVLPYRGVQNSSAAVAALSLDRPVALTRSPVASALRDEVGADWVLLLGDRLDSADLARVLAELDRTHGPREVSEPDLSRRRWDSIAVAHVRAYEQAVARRRPT